MRSWGLEQKRGNHDFSNVHDEKDVLDFLSTNTRYMHSHFPTQVPRIGKTVTFVPFVPRGEQKA